MSETLGLHKIVHFSIVIPIQGRRRVYSCASMDPDQTHPSWDRGNDTLSHICLPNPLRRPSSGISFADHARNLCIQWS